MEGIHHGGSGVLSLNVGQVAGIHHARGELERHGCGEIPKKEKLLFKVQTFSRPLGTCMWVALHYGDGGDDGQYDPACERLQV